MPSCRTPLSRSWPSLCFAACCRRSARRRRRRAVCWARRAARRCRDGTALQWLFVGVQVTLAVVLLTGSGLLIRSFLELSRVDPGFEPSRILSFRVSGSYEDFEELAPRVEEILGELRGFAGRRGRGELGAGARGARRRLRFPIRARRVQAARRAHRRTIRACSRSGASYRRAISPRCKSRWCRVICAQLGRAIPV